MIYKTKKSIIFALLLIVGTYLSPQNAAAQKSIKWNYTTIDSTFNPAGANKASKIIAKYKPTIDPLMEVIGYTNEELTKSAPESPLSNLSADIIAEYSQQYLQKKNIDGKINFALTNFGGIRTTLPKGDISSFDILSIFPFDNRLVILDIEGKYVRELMENFAKRGRVEVLSGVEVIINNKKLEKCLIDGSPIDDNKIYKLATIDFLLSGGDNLYALKNATNVIETNVILREAVIEYIKEKTAKGEKITGEMDSRVIIK